MYNKAGVLGLCKSAAFLRSPESGIFSPGNQKGRATQFKPGHHPHNKGIKGWSAGGNSIKTQFKKGNRPQTWVPIGSERITKDGILQRKISDTGYRPRDWKSVHSLLWEKHHGPVPVGCIVVFKNGNKNLHIDNLECISRAENMRRNSIHNIPKELADVCRLKGVLNRRINERIKKNEKQNRRFKKPSLCNN